MPRTIIHGKTLLRSDLKSGGSLRVTAEKGPDGSYFEQTVHSGDAIATPSLESLRRARDKPALKPAAAPAVVSNHFSLPGFAPHGGVAELNFNRRGRRPKRDNVVLKV